MAFGAALGADFPMLSDWEGTVASSYGVRYRLWKDHAGVAKRSVFVIDAEGRVRYRWVTEDAMVVPDLNEAVLVLKSLADRSHELGGSPAGPE
jgi:glutaredoxin-dependent peroxiredoxin